MTDYICKPFDPFKLVETIEEQLSATEGAAPEPFEVTEMPEPAVIIPAVEAERDPAEDLAVIIDRPSLLRRCLGKAELADKLLVKLHARLGADLYEIKTAADAGDCDLLGRCAHRLKGAAANLSAEPLRAVSADLEMLARSGNIGAARDALAKLKYESRRFLQETLPLVPATSPERAEAALAETVLSGEVPCAS
jgi:HPt (histidine-containing phosphotransfer) domain-containing protein